MNVGLTASQVQQISETLADRVNSDAGPRALEAVKHVTGAAKEH